MRKCIYYFLFLSITFKKLVFSQNNSDGYFDVFPVKNSSVDITNTTVIISQSIDMGKCLCDMTAGMCDYLCCCDTDCSQEEVNYWSNSPLLTCKDRNKFDIAKTAACSTKSQTYNYNRNVGLMQYFDFFRNLFCVAIDNSNEMGFFYNNINQTESQFLSFNQQQASQLLVYYYRYVLNSVSTPYIESILYKINDPLRISSNTASYSNLDSLFIIYDKGAYGECRRTGTVKFMVNIPSYSCGLNIFFIEPQLDKCVTYGYEQILSKKISTAPLVSSPSVPIKINSIYLKNLETNSYRNSNGIFPSSTLTRTGNVCNCNNILIESHYTFIMNNSNNTIISLNLDLVLADSIQGNCNSNFLLPQTLSFKFTTSTNNFYRSGNPGYIIKSNLLISTNKTVNGKTMFTVRKNGFYLQGRNNDGSCATGSNYIYSNFDIPIRFKNNVVYSCSMNYNPDAFIQFCSSKEWKNFILYKMVNDIQYIGIFGNANYTYLQDWLTVQNDIDLDNFSLNTTITSCYFPANIKLDIVYAKAGSIDNPQDYIVAARLSSNNVIYTHISKFDQIKVNINFIINYVELDKTYFSQTKFSSILLDFLPKNIADPYISG